MPAPLQQRVSVGFVQHESFAFQAQLFQSVAFNWGQSASAILLQQTIIFTPLVGRKNAFGNFPQLGVT